MTNARERGSGLGVAAQAGVAERIAEPYNFRELVTLARGLAMPGTRRILGITGAPGAGKSTLAAGLVDALDGSAALVAMDGFHLANSVLHKLERRDRKGAMDTFDVRGYVALLKRLTDQTDGIVYAPEFDRIIDESVGSAVPINSDIPLIITEGNYLLHDRGGWQDVRPLLDQTWFVAPPEELRQHRLIRRHEQVGLSREDAQRWALGSDQQNAEIVARTCSSATLVLSVADLPVRIPVEAVPEAQKVNVP